MKTVIISLGILRTSVCLAIISAVSVLSFFSNVSAQSSAADVRRVVTATAPMTKSLGGGKAGELNLNTKAVVLESRGSWSRVKVEAWVRTKSLSNPKVAGGTARAVTKPLAVDGDLKVENYVLTHRTDVSPARQYLMLTVKNIGEKAVSSWNAVLLARDAAGKTLFREPVSQDKGQLRPGESTDVSFYWQPDEELYGILRGVGSQKLKMRLIELETVN